MTEKDFPKPELAALASSLEAANLHIQSLNQATLAQQRHISCIAAPTGSEGKRAAWLAGALNSWGYRTHLDSDGNVIATQAARDAPSKPPVVCMAHLDTIFEHDTTLEPVVDGERIACPGIGDNGRGLAAMLTLAFVLSANRWQTLGRPIEFVATVGEEGLGNLRGARAYFANRSLRDEAAPHAVVVLDGPGDQHIVHHALGSCRYHLTFHGVGGHSWADFGTPNAVHAAARAASMLSEIPRNTSQRIAVTASSIGGGESVNSIPASAWLNVDVRATDRALLAETDRELRRLVQLALEQECANASRTRFPRSKRGSSENTDLLRSEITVVGERPTGALAPEHPLVKLAQHVSVMHGIEPISAVASTDANIPLSLGIPAITIGGGGTGGGAHTVSEWYDNTNGPRGIQRALAIVAALAV